MVLRRLIKHSVRPFKALRLRGEILFGDKRLSKLILAVRVLNEEANICCCGSNMWQGFQREENTRKIELLQAVT